MFSCCELYGELAQLGEHLPCTQGVKGSSPLFSTTGRRPGKKYLENRITCIKQTQKKRNRDNTTKRVFLDEAKGKVRFQPRKPELFIE